MQFFERIAGIADLKAEIDLVTILGESCLDKSTVSAFIAFLNANLENLVSPEDILGAKKIETVAARLGKLVDRDVKRVDILAAVCTRLINHLILRRGALAENELANLREFLKLAVLPEDMRLALAQDLSLLDAKKGVGKILGDPEVARLLLRLAGTKKS